jgi:hypothetical protein
MAIETLVAEGDMVAVRIRSAGTNRGSWVASLRRRTSDSLPSRAIGTGSPTAGSASTGRRATTSRRCFSWSDQASWPTWLGRRSSARARTAATLPRRGTRDSTRYPAPASAIARRNDPGSAPRLLVVVRSDSAAVLEPPAGTCCFSRGAEVSTCLLLVVPYARRPDGSRGVPSRRKQ